MYHQVVSFIATLIKAHTSLGITDEIILTLLKLQGIDVKLGIDVTGIE